MANDSAPATTENGGKKSGLRTIVAASAAGTTFEWYDFFIFGTLTSIITKNFFSGLSDTAGMILALLTFALGFMSRPLGALIFGHIGDRKGRKGTFLYTILIMGIATVLIGFLPTFEQAGIVAPLLLMALRIVQGIAMGGEYGGAAIYVAEHAPADKRGAFTSWIQTSAGLGLIAALAVILVTRTLTGEEAFADWGWRIPFIISIGLLAVSVYVRTKTAESPSFKALHDKGAVVKDPFRQSFGKWSNLKKVLIALFAFMTAQGVVWYTTFFYTQVFLEKTVRLEPATINYLVMAMTVLSAPLYIFFGSLSDKIGRKKVMVTGIAVAVISFFPGFHMMVKFANPALDQAISKTPVLIFADPRDCSVQFDPVGKAQFTSPCDLAKGIVTNLGVPYQSRASEPGAVAATVQIGTEMVAIRSGAGLEPAEVRDLKLQATTQIKAALIAAGYPEKADPKRANLWGVFAVLMVFALGATALYGPMASMLVEMFPTNVRYTALSLPYNIGTGWFGGLLPAISFSMVAGSGNIYFGLWYPVIIGSLAVVVALLCLKDYTGRDLDTIPDDE
ncbi:MFS transporter [Asticcacaulis endophyticus]|uniref:MFS transporter n=1 Tax=Asticcacaulis endophyticus TaxID=1395890 RepID=A0A918PU57_9CAUL|nr:MFS transporter [Asticcacaulis endophyticus]GGZ23304.1 MFS transporter [Asticcacaulis endophyticus]